MTSLRPAEVDLLVAITKQTKGSLDFSEASDKLGISASAAQQRWGRLKSRIASKGDVTLKPGDEHVLITSLAKQFGTGEVDFDKVGQELNCGKSAAQQRWGRLRLKIVGKNGLVGGPKLKPTVPGKVTKSPTKGKTTKVNKANLEKGLKAAESARAKSEGSQDMEEDQDEEMIAAQLHEKSGMTGNSGYGAEEEFVDASAKPNSPMVFNPLLTDEEDLDPDDWVGAAFLADDLYNAGLH